MKFFYDLQKNSAKLNLSCTTVDTITRIHVNVKFDKPQVPSRFCVYWEDECTDAYSTWTSTFDFSHILLPDWAKNVSPSSFAFCAPVFAMFKRNGNNKMTIAVSDAKNPIEIKSGVDEVTSILKCSVEFFVNPTDVISEYNATIYINEQNIRFHDALKDVDRFWSEECGLNYASIPDTARRPVYSAWYSFHQNIDVDKIVEQCKLAKALGMESIIVDDGWQTDDAGRGYDYCGDWEPAASKVPDMKEFVSRVHETGLKFILWFSVPHLGIHSKAYERFKTMVLSPTNKSTGTLDPRYPEVRKYLVSIYENAARAWGVDGFKLDFIDDFRRRPDTPLYDDRRDIVSLEDAAEQLLIDITSTLKSINPDVLIEFRQSYYGPTIRKYGNMIRVGDCPNDSRRNKVIGTNMRWLLGKTPVHSDMLMWNVHDEVNVAAHQVICTLFCVPQISMRINELPESHREMLKFWLKFWNTHRDTLLDGCLYADSPESNYSCIGSEKDGECILVSYDNQVMQIPGGTHKFYGINATGKDSIILMSDSDNLNAEIYDCTGRLLRREILSSHLSAVNVPDSGFIKINL